MQSSQSDHNYIATRAVKIAEKKANSNKIVLTTQGRTTLWYRFRGMLDRGSTKEEVMENAKNIKFARTGNKLGRTVLWKHLDEISPYDGNAKIRRHHRAVQECSECGKQFTLLYLDDGSYEYLEEPCECDASFHPVDGELSISEWLETIKKG